MYVFFIWSRTSFLVMLTELCLNKYRRFIIYQCVNSIDVNHIQVACSSILGFRLHNQVLTLLCDRNETVRPVVCAK